MKWNEMKWNELSVKLQPWRFMQARMARTIIRVPWKTKSLQCLPPWNGQHSAGVEQLHTCLFHRLMTVKLTEDDHSVPFNALIPFDTASTSSNRHHRKPCKILPRSIRSQAFFVKAYMVKAWSIREQAYLLRWFGTVLGRTKCASFFLSKPIVYGTSS